MDYSVFIENKHNNNSNSNQTESEPLRYTLPKRIHKWVDDNAVTSCYNCNAAFSLFFRRHHCRLCCRIFCSNCVKYNAIIPEDLLSNDSKSGSLTDYFSLSYKSNTLSTQSHKVCRSCKDIISFIDSVKHIIDTFIIFNLDIKILKSLALVCKQWHYASNYILSIFKEIQYKLPTDEYTDLEKKLLKTNAKYIAGHNRYLVHLIKIYNPSDPEYSKIINLLYNKKSTQCWSIMCQRKCQSLTSFDAIELLCYCFKTVGHNDKLKLAALDHIKCSDTELKCYLPLLVYYLNFDNGIISDFLVKRCVTNFNLFNALYWELQLYTANPSNAYISILNKLKELFKDKAHSGNFVKILEGYSFVKIVENISSEICDKNKKYEEIKDNFKLKGLLTSPLNSKNRIQEIFIEKIKIKNSATKPMNIPCKTCDKEPINILYKREDIRKDQAIMNVIKLMDIILKQEEKLDLGIVTYNILPTDKNSGLIEIIDECDTMFYIREKLCTSITNYILENNDDKTVKQIRDNFINSTAAYSVITYLLGIGDRHLDNIMITKDGKLFHIDYGYILGNDPVTSNPGIRITPEIVDALGGLSSKNYEKFIELCTRIYNCLRRHINLFMSMLSILPNISDLKLTQEHINKFLTKRFIPGENTYDANFHLIVQLERQDYVYAIKDWFHYHSQEKTVSSAMTRLTYAMSKLIQYTAPEEPIHGTQLRKTVMN